MWVTRVGNNAFGSRIPFFIWEWVLQAGTHLNLLTQYLETRHGKNLTDC
jgi:hypothetical protein